MPEQKIEQLETAAQTYQRLAEKEAVDGLTPEETARLKDAQVRVGLSDHVHVRDQEERRFVLGGEAAASRIITETTVAIEQKQAELEAHREKNKTVFARADQIQAEIGKLNDHQAAAQDRLALSKQRRSARRDLFGK